MHGPSGHDYPPIVKKVLHHIVSSRCLSPYCGINFVQISLAILNDIYEPLSDRSCCTQIFELLISGLNQVHPILQNA